MQGPSLSFHCVQCFHCLVKTISCGERTRFEPLNEENRGMDWGALALLIGGMLITTIILFLATSGLIPFHGLGAISLYTVLGVVSSTMMTVAICCLCGKGQAPCYG